MGGLSDDEVRALTGAFPDEVSARHVLVAASLPVGLHPVLNVRTAEQMWREVSALLENGALPGGRRALFVAALERFPANPVFEAGAGVVSTRWKRVLPSWDLLPSLPARFVQREADTARVRELLCGPCPEGRPGGSPVVGLVGMGGVGKSVLARALVHDPLVRRAFPDGIAWVEVGQRPGLSGVASEVLGAFGDRRPVVHVDDVAGRLRSLLAGARCLVVLDDVWSVDVLRALRMPAGITLLVTTRDRKALFDDARVIDLENARPDLARQVLAAYAGQGIDDLSPAVTTILNKCGGLVLALAVAGAMVGGGYSWEYVSARMSRSELSELAADFQDYPHPNLLTVLDASAETLTDEQAARFREMTVFEDRDSVPAEAAFLLWEATGGLDRMEAERLLTLLAQRNLVEFGPAARTVTLHPLLFDYVRLGPKSMGQAAAGLHLLLAERLLDRWGGLAKGLPGLRDPAAFGALDRYGMLSLVGHLLAGERPDIVDELLAAERSSASRGVEGVWFSVHDDLGHPGDYIADLRAAWQNAKARFSAGDPQGLVRQIPYAFYVGSVTSLAATRPPALLARLVETGTWPVSRALTYAQATPHPEVRFEALAGLVPRMPADQRGPVLEQVLAIGEALPDTGTRAEVLAQLAKYLETGQLDEGPSVAAVDRLDGAEPFSGPAPPLSTAALVEQFVAAAGDHNSFGKARELARLAPYLPANLLREALSVAELIESPHARAEALAGLAPYLSADLLGAALTAATASGDWRDRDRSVNLLAPHLPAVLLGRALAAVGAVNEPHDRSAALARLVPHVPAEWRGPLLASALADAAAANRPYVSLDALARLAPHLSTTQMKEALAVAVSIDERHGRVPALASMTPFLSEGLLSEAFAGALAIADPYLRAVAVNVLASRLPSELLDQALESARAADDPYVGAIARAGVAPYLSTEQRRRVLDEAISLAGEVTDPLCQAEALAMAAQHLSPEDVSPALVAAFALDDVHGQIKVLSRLIPLLPVKRRRRVLDRALEASWIIDDPRRKAEALMDLVPHLRGTSRDAELSRALTAVALIDDPHDRWEALSGLAPHLPLSAAEQGAALAAVYALDDVTGLVEELPALRSHLPSGFLDRALNGVGDLHDSRYQAEALAGLARHLPAATLGRVLDAVVAIEDPLDRAIALSVLVKYLPVDLLDRAMETARAIDDPGSQAKVLSALVPRLPAVDRGPLLGEALELASSAGRSQVLAVLTTVLSAMPDVNIAAVTTSSVLRAYCWWP
ncbi:MULTISPECIES: NB-ARC domain-containing protein [unclassified Frankia]|uniref:NB-ARC domain-containing protein n=1 Tax=unclassified Frankia TaxID=2632575 RepID=UPI002AD43FC9|nr:MULTISPECIES: NB-ARC domain-containing protein [unclassified Frankia]